MSGLPDRPTPMPQSMYEEIYVSHTVWHYSVKSYSRPEILPDGEWSVYSFTLPDELYVLLKVTKRWRKLLTGTMVILLCAQTGFGVYFAYSLFHLWDLLRLHEAVFTAMVPYYILRVVLDAMVSATLCIILYDARGFTRSMKLIKTLIVYSMNRFLLTTIVVVAQTIILIAKPESIWAMVIEFISAQLYVNSFLAMLNSRNRLRNIGGQESVYVYSNSRQGVSAVSVPRFKRESYGETQRGEEDKYPTSDAISGIRVGTETVALSDFSIDAKAEANRAALESA
ncbi:hypothetical protein EYR36_006812 [Pleurotus pulmonarius]|nr:hypothetical protein EYR36_006812 [Pleurotus pulmonarius]